MKKVAIIIDTHHVSRSLDASQSRPKSLEIINNNAVIDWTLHALKMNNISDITYIGGYHIEKILEKHPSINHRYHVNRLKEGELKALCLFSPMEHDEIIILRGSTLILPNVFESIKLVDHMVGYYDANEGKKFSGFLKIGKSLINQFFNMVSEYSAKNTQASFEDFLVHLKDEEINIEHIMIDGMAAPVSDQLAVAKTVFQGKGKTLQHLAPLVQKGIVLDQLRFSVPDWKQNRAAVLKQIQNKYTEGLIIVRSCATAEDRTDVSSAGLYHSVLDVEPQEITKINEAIELVIESYGKNGRVISDVDEILVQQQLTNLIASGVLLTRDPSSAAPYFVLSIDRKTKRSDTVTSGLSDSIENYYISRHIEKHSDPLIDKIVHLSKELVALSHLDALDIEFGVSETEEVFLFQVRPLVLKEDIQKLQDADFFDAQNEMRKFVTNRIQSDPSVSGKASVLSVMSDWNPAEMIGKKPKPLALSLYQTLIGHSNWAKARAHMGYKDMSAQPLILSVGGVPYVDVRISLNSLLPLNTDPYFSEKWIDYCIERLSKTKCLHDKIEFDLTITCLSPDWNRRAEDMRANGFKDIEIIGFKNVLHEVTEKAIKHSPSDFSLLSQKLENLSNRKLKTNESSSEGMYGYARNINYIMTRLGEFGIIPFSIFARNAFISIAFLRGMLQEGVIDNDCYDKFLEAIPTPASAFIQDKFAYSEGKITLDKMLSSYGHLRPNSYEITAENYASHPSLYFYSNRHEKPKNLEDPKKIMIEKRAAIKLLLQDLGLAVDVNVFIDYMIQSIQGREFAKFEFMKDVNLLMENIIKFGSCFGLSRNELSYLPLEDLLKFSVASSMKACEKNMLRTIEFNKKKWSLTTSLQLPDVICEPGSIENFKVEDWKANYVTKKRVQAETVWLEDKSPPYYLDGKIVVIRAADPGYDWIFSHKIAGLITEYGGIASHMAIRAAEFGLPAAIGCGIKLLNTIRGSHKIELDCANGLLKAI